MSGRSGYRKTDRRRFRSATPRPKSDYVLRFQLPVTLAAFLSPGSMGWGVVVGYNGAVFVTGQHPAHCCQLAADFFEKIGARRFPQMIAARTIKLLTCSAHCPPRSEGFKKLTIDVEALHDRVSRFEQSARSVSIDIGADRITFKGERDFINIVHDYAERRAGAPA